MHRRLGGRLECGCTSGPRKNQNHWALDPVMNGGEDALYHSGTWSEGNGSMACGILCIYPIQSMGVVYIYLHLADFYGKCNPFLRDKEGYNSYNHSHPFRTSGKWYMNSLFYKLFQAKCDESRWWRNIPAVVSTTCGLENVSPYSL